VWDGVGFEPPPQLRYLPNFFPQNFPFFLCAMYGPIDLCSRNGCVNMRTDNLEKKFCTSCGKQLKYECECKKTIVIMEKFCGACGAKNPHYDAGAKASA